MLGIFQGLGPCDYEVCNRMVLLGAPHDGKAEEGDANATGNHAVGKRPGGGEGRHRADTSPDACRRRMDRLGEVHRTQMTQGGVALGATDDREWLLPRHCCWLGGRKE